MSKIAIFSAQTSDGNSLAFNPIGSGSPGDKQDTFFTIFGTFGTGSLELQYKASDGNYYSSGDGFISAPCCWFVETNSNTSYRFALTGSDGSTSISIDVFDASLAS